MKKPEKKNTIFINVAFLITSIALVTFLLNAPEETTAKIPHNDDHNMFFGMKKKEAEKYCADCHNQNDMPLPENHPPKYRCLFCHKR